MLSRSLEGALSIRMHVGPAVLCEFRHTLFPSLEISLLAANMSILFVCMIYCFTVDVCLI